MKGIIQKLARTRYGDIRCVWAILIYIAVASVINSAFSGPNLSSHVWSPFVERMIPIVVALTIWKLLYRKPMEQFGFTKEHMLSRGLCGYLCAGVAMTTIFIALLLIGSIQIDSFHPGVFADPQFYLGFILTLLVGFAEEIQFRGFCMGALKSTRNPYLVMGLSSVWFSFAHLQNAGFTWSVALGVLIGGIFFAYLFLKSGTLFVGMMFHAAWNFFESRIFGIGISSDVPSLIVIKNAKSDFWLGSPSFGVEGGAIAIAVLLLGLVWIHCRINNPTRRGFVIDPPSASPRSQQANT